MNIELRRTNIYKTCIDGAVYIDNAFVCHTEENVTTALPAGEYPIGLVKCKQYGRNMPVILTAMGLQCSLCKEMKDVNHNTRMPQVCPMLKPGNGVHKREDGSVILGTRIVPGCLSHPREAFGGFYNRIRKKLERGREVVLKIKNGESSNCKL